MEENNKRVFIHLPAFTGRNVPIMELAKATGKDPQYLRISLQQGILKFGFAFKKDNSLNLITIVQIKKSGKKQGISMEQFSDNNTLEIKRLSDIKSTEVEWLWYPYIPLGKLTIIQGDPGSGKTMLILYLASLLSSGFPRPNDKDTTITQ